MQRLAAITLLVMSTALAGQPVPAVAQASDPCIGQLMLFGGNFCPRGWADANGQLISIAQNSALFSIYGTMYGGDGTSTFGLPDLRGRAPISQGQGPGLPNYTQGQLAGAPTVTLSSQNNASHSHAVMATDSGGQSDEPAGGILGGGTPVYAASGTANTTMAPSMIGQSGNNIPFSVQNPVQVIRWCVALQGAYCQRN